MVASFDPNPRQHKKATIDLVYTALVDFTGTAFSYKTIIRFE